MGTELTLPFQTFFVFLCEVIFFGYDFSCIPDAFKEHLSNGTKIAVLWFTILNGPSSLQRVRAFLKLLCYLWSKFTRCLWHGRGVCIGGNSPSMKPNYVSVGRKVRSNMFVLTVKDMAV